MNEGPQLFRPSQLMLFSRFWWSYKDQAVIARRRLGKSRFAMQTAILLMYYAIGLLTKAYPQFQSDKIDEHMRLIRRNNEDRGVTFRSTYYLPGQEQSHKLFTTAFKESMSHVYHCLPTLKKVPIQWTQNIANLEWGENSAFCGHKGIARDVRNQRGNGNELAIIDEIQDHVQEDLKDVVYPTLLDNQGRRLLIGTANARPILQEVKRTYENSKSRNLFIINIDESVKNKDPDCPSEEAKQELIKRDYGGNAKDYSYLREFMCMLDLPISGAILEHWRPKIAEHQDGNPVVLSVDIGINDPYAVLAWSVFPDRTFSLIDGFRIRGKITEQVIPMARDMLRRRGLPLPQIVILPHDAWSRTTSSFRTDVIQWKESEISENIRKANKYSLKEKEISAMLAIMGRVNRSKTVNETVMKDLNNWAYNIESATHPDRPLHNIHSHVGDAYSYGVIGIFATMQFLVPPVPVEKKEVPDFLETHFPSDVAAKARKMRVEYERDQRKKTSQNA